MFQPFDSSGRRVDARARASVRQRPLSLRRTDVCVGRPYDATSFATGKISFCHLSRHARGGIEDESVPCMAAEALAHVLISHGTCRLAWAEQGSFLSLLDLMR